MSHWLPQSHIDRNRPLGGKADKLTWLGELGFPVPKWGVIPADSLQRLLPANHLQIDIQALILNYEFDEAWLAPIRAYFGLGSSLAVRSSALQEDGQHSSFAGQFHTELYVQAEDLAAAIRTVWASAYSERVRTYQQAQGLEQLTSMAIIVQEMVPATAAGVAFGLDPVSGDRSTQVISAVWGLGEGLVDGSLDADMYYLSQGQLTDSQIATKTHYIGSLPEGQSGTRPIALPPEKQTQAVLTKLQAKTISNWLQALYTHSGRYQDIEFAVCDQELFMLQARPITGVAGLADTKAARFIWDNSNIVESYPGLTLPLTFSFITKMYEAVYRQLVNLLGVQEDVIEANKTVFTNMLGLIQGRVYYNLYGWYKALSLLPGYSLNAEFMETMMGVKERFELADHEPLSKWQSYRGILRMLNRMWVNFRRLPKETKQFQQAFESVLIQYNQLPLDHMRPEEVMHAYRKVEDLLVKRWKPPLVNDFFAMIFFGLLQKQGEQFGLPHLHNDLLSGSRDIISTQPMYRLQAISAYILQHKDLHQLFLTTKPTFIWQRLQEGAFPEVLNLIQSYIELFGERVSGELKLESVTYEQDPSLLMSIIQAYVRQGIQAADTHSHDSSIRKAAEEEAQLAVRGKWGKKMVFGFILKHARRLVSNRENLRFERTRAFGLVRKMFLSLGRSFYAAGQLDEMRDIFYLKQGEVFDFIEGKAVDQDLKALVRLRKQQYAQYQEAQVRERIEVNGIPYYGHDLSAHTTASLHSGELTGIGCSPGIVSAPVKVVHDPRALHDLAGHILVCKSTDPGWVPLFPTAGGLLVERGSLLSHAAIVAREMEKPCIVGIDGLLTQLNTGDHVEMDGRTGMVKIVSSISLEASHSPHA